MRALFSCGFLALVTSACATTSPPGPARPRVSDYVPIAVGNSWTYAVRFPGQSGQRTIRIVEHNDEGYFVDDAGGAFKITEAGLRDPKRYLIRTPVEPGQTWTAVVSMSSVEHYTIASVGEPCQARAGRFADCIVVTSRIRRDDRMSLQSRFTWAKAVGLVKIETSAIIDGQEKPQTEQSLLRYRVGGQTGGQPETDASEPTMDQGAPPPWSR